MISVAEEVNSVRVFISTSIDVTASFSRNTIRSLRMVGVVLPLGGGSSVRSPLESPGLEICGAIISQQRIVPSAEAE